MIKGALALVGFAVVAYVFFFVPLGERTMFEHVRRIAATEEAQDLGDEAGQAAGELKDHIEDEINEHVRVDAGIAP